MQVITKRFETQRQAENYLQKLYDVYSYVRLVSWPCFAEVGEYTFLVQD